MLVGYEFFYRQQLENLFTMLSHPFQLPLQYPDLDLDLDLDLQLGQINFSVFYVHILLFYINCPLTYFILKYF